jgi:hypothetical protein
MCHRHCPRFHASWRRTSFSNISFDFVVFFFFFFVVVAVV